MEGTEMLPFAIGLMLAVGFGLLTGTVYGVESLFSEPWVMLVPWGLVTGPALMAFAGPHFDDKRSRRCDR
jgi:hypothetical protein